jgi:hypothetical protein
MPITTERTVALAMPDDAYGVEVWQERKTVNYSTDDARALAAEILAAAEEADRIEREDRDAAFAGEVCTPTQFPDVSVVVS